MKGDVEMGEGESRVVELTRAECLDILGRHGFGRLAVVEEGQPAIFPINYVLDGDRVVFRSAAGSKLDHSSLDRVAFEVDEFDDDLASACSVLVKGTAREITEAIDAQSRRERDLAVSSWMPPGELHWVRIVPHEITGRQVFQP
jgi:nitroimidazol reductase NimA-like FMN-containing flavoprotein (pyridoxamine 5'-phosphate oxidase superfamily)